MKRPTNGLYMRSSQSLKIVNVKLDPDPPFQNQGDSVDLTAEVLAVGLGDLEDEDINWWVELLGPDGLPATEDPIATGIWLACWSPDNGVRGKIAIAVDAASHTRSHLYLCVVADTARYLGGTLGTI